MRYAAAVILALLLTACDKESAPVTPHSNDTTATPPVVPSDSGRFITIDYIELDKIAQISLFRSGAGHDYHDGVEQCRSMKHYFQPKGSVDWNKIKIFSPVRGRIVRRDEEWAGTQLHIAPFDHPTHTVIIFHINLFRPLAVGDTVAAGEQLGTHIGSQTMSDIAVANSASGTWKLLSWFDVMTDSLFQRYKARGAAARSDFIISKAARDADPLNCSGETFGTEGTLPNWFILK